MNKSPDFIALPPSRDTFLKIALVFGAAVTLIGTVGLLGWILDITALKSVMTGLATMKVNTAIGFIFSGTMVWLLAMPSRWSQMRRVAMALAVLVAVIGGLTMIAYLLKQDFGLDELLFRDLATAPDNFPGRMSFGTAFCFVLIAAAYLMRTWRSSYLISQILAVMVAAASLIALLGYLYGTDSLYATFFFSTMALHTALSFFLISIGLLCTMSNRGPMTIFGQQGPGGRMARWLVPSAVLIPIFLGWVFQQGVRLDFYDQIFAHDLLILTTIVTITGLVLFTAFIVQRAFEARQVTRRALIRRNREYRTLSACNQALIRVHDEEKLLNIVCENVTNVGGYLVAWFGRVETPDTIHIVSLATRVEVASGSSLTLQPDPACIRPITEKARRLGTPQVASDFMQNAPECVEEAQRLGYASVIALPVHSENHDSHLYGVLHVYSEQPDSFDPQALDLLEELADDLGFGLATIRERKARQEAEATIHYQADLLDNVSDAIIATDMEFNIRAWNKAAEAIYGWSEADALGRQIDPLLWTRIAGDSTENILKSLRERGRWRGEVTQHTRDGKTVRILSSISFVYDSEAHIDGVVAVNRDVTEFVEMKEQLIAAELERATLEKERELINLKEEFIATVTHDFRTPLTVIITSSEILFRHYDRLEVERRLAQLSRIRDQAQYMTLLLNDVLDFTKARSGKIDYDPTTFNLVTFCQSLFEQLQVNGTPQHRFVFASQGELETALMDRHLLQRVLVNLLSNAVKYSPNGGDVRFEVRRDGDDVIFIISDQGIGIAAKDQDLIYQPFFRARNSREFQGTGLGMSIVYENIKAQGGSIKLQSEENKGSVFEVRLPYRQPTIAD